MRFMREDRRQTETNTRQEEKKRDTGVAERARKNEERPSKTCAKTRAASEVVI